MKYDVALSFAGEDRKYVKDVAERLKEAGIRVFYDEFEAVDLWGKDLYTHLQHIYQKEAEYTVIFISKFYAKKLWTNHERKGAQARAFAEPREYILPARFDDTEIEGMLPTTGFIDLRRYTPQEFTDFLLKKTKERISEYPPRNTSETLTNKSKWLIAGTAVISLLVITGVIALFISLNNPNRDAYTQTTNSRNANIGGNSDTITNQNNILSEKELFEIAFNCGRNRNYDCSIENFTKAIKLNPNNAETYYNRGVAYIEKAAFDQAVEDFTTAIKLKPDYTNAYFNRGNVYDRKGEYEQGIKDFTEVIKLEPDKAKAYQSRGVCYSELGRHDKAINDYTEAIKLEANYPDNYLNRGTAYANKGDFDKAITDYRKVLEIDPSNPYAKQFLASALSDKEKK